MKNQAYRMAMLYDFYGDLLTARQKEFYDLYYNDDLSLAEIAENYGITRQGVRDIIVRAEKTLEDIEEKTGLIQRYHPWPGWPTWPPPCGSCAGSSRPAARLWGTTPSWTTSASSSARPSTTWRGSDFPWHLKD